MTDIAIRLDRAGKESEARRALKRYLMLKAVLIKPVRRWTPLESKNEYDGKTYKTSFYKGKEQEIWNTSLGIEKQRRKNRLDHKNKRGKRNRKGDAIEKRTSKDEVQRRSDKAKTLTNDGELVRDLQQWFREVWYRQRKRLSVN